MVVFILVKSLTRGTEIEKGSENLIVPHVLGVVMTAIHIQTYTRIQILLHALQHMEIVRMETVQQWSGSEYKWADYRCIAFALYYTLNIVPLHASVFHSFTYSLWTQWNSVFCSYDLISIAFHDRKNSCRQCEKEKKTNWDV